MRTIGFFSGFFHVIFRGSLSVVYEITAFENYVDVLLGKTCLSVEFTDRNIV